MINHTDIDIPGRAAARGHQEAKTAVTFDWCPVVTNERVQFHLALVRGSERSNVTLELDLNQLTEGELERLHFFLVRRHLCATTHDEMAAAICWLVDCALSQSNPLLSLAERTSRLRALLLLPERGSQGEHLAR